MESGESGQTLANAPHTVGQGLNLGPASATTLPLPKAAETAKAIQRRLGLA